MNMQPALSRSMLIDLVQLRTFVAVAEEQHLTRAAERLHISQSAASAHVRSVEDSLDTQLFVRTNRSLELTRAGQMMLRRARTLLHGAVEFTSFAREIRGKFEGNLVVGASSEPSASRIGEVVAALRAKHPLISIDVRARASSDARQGLKTGELDIGILLGRPLDAGFTSHQLATMRFRVAGPVAWKAQLEHADWKDLASLPWITPSQGSEAYSTTMLSRLLGDRGLKPTNAVKFDNATLGRTLLRAGVGLMLVHEQHALQGERDGWLALSLCTPRTRPAAATTR